MRSNSITSNSTKTTSTPNPKVSELRSKFREAWSVSAEPNGRLSSKNLLSVLQHLECFRTTINVGKREAPRYITFNGVPNDVVFLLKSLGYTDHEIATNVYLDYKLLEQWYINHVSIRNYFIKRVINTEVSTFFVYVQIFSKSREKKIFIVHWILV